MQAAPRAGVVPLHNYRRSGWKASKRHLSWCSVVCGSDGVSRGRHDSLASRGASGHQDRCQHGDKASAGTDSSHWDPGAPLCVLWWVLMAMPLPMGDDLLREDFGVRAGKG